MDFEGSWAVRYKDGTILSQWESDKETPLRNIDWPNVDKVIFDSQWETRELNIQYDSAYLVPHLRTRTLMVQQHGQMRIFMIVLSLIGEPVSDESVQYVLYWIPTGVIHECHMFNCPDVSRWATSFTAGQVESLSARHDMVEVMSDAYLE